MLGEVSRLLVKMQLPEFSQLRPWRNLISLSSESSLFLLSLHSMRFFRRRASSVLTGRASSSRSDGLRPLHLPMNILLSWFKSSVKGPPSSRPPLVSRTCLLYGLSVTVDMFNISPSLQVNWHRNISYVRELITYSKGNSRWVFVVMLILFTLCSRSGRCRPLQISPCAGAHRERR